MIPINPDDELFPATPAPVLVVESAQERIEEHPAPTPATAVPVIAPVGFQAMTPQERVAILTAMKAALEEQIELEKSTLIENVYGATDTTSLDTSFGPVSVNPGGKQSIVVDPEKMLEYAKANAPETIQQVVSETVADSYRETLMSDVIDVGDGVIVRASTGEQVDYAHLGKPSTPQVSWPASKQQKITKARARQALREHLPTLVEPMTLPELNA